MLLVDSGDMLPAVLDRQGELKGEVLARAYGLMRYDAITLGETDLFFGPAYLGNLISAYGLPIVSMNVETDSRPLAGMPPYLVKEIGGVRVALVGMLNHRVLLPASVTDSVEVASMEERFLGLLPEIEERSDLIVALAHVGSVSRARALADSFPQLDVVIAGHVEPAPPPYYEDVNGVLVAYVRSQGRFMGRLNLLLDEDDKVIGFGHEMVPMAPELQDDPDVLRLLAEYIDRLKILVASTAFRPTLKDLYVPSANYVTAAACRECHAEQDEQWSATTHARAFDSIEKRKRDFDPECQSCHTTGFRYRTGFITPRGTPQLKHVQCEACHGPGGDHLDDPGALSTGRPGEATDSGTAPYGAVTEATCARCHTPHNSPEFDYEKYIERVKHK